jgi:hypothetical protein
MKLRRAGTVCKAAFPSAISRCGTLVVQAEPLPKIPFQWCSSETLVEQVALLMSFSLARLTTHQFLLARVDGPPLRVVLVASRLSELSKQPFLTSFDSFGLHLDQSRRVMLDRSRTDNFDCSEVLSMGNVYAFSLRSRRPSTSLKNWPFHLGRAFVSGWSLGPTALMPL